MKDCKAWPLECSSDGSIWCQDSNRTCVHLCRVDEEADIYWQQDHWYVRVLTEKNLWTDSNNKVLSRTLNGATWAAPISADKPARVPATIRRISWKMTATTCDSTRKEDNFVF